MYVILKKVRHSSPIFPTLELYSHYALSGLSEFRSRHQIYIVGLQSFSFHVVIRGN
jgi:hypothetical protein